MLACDLTALGHNYGSSQIWQHGDTDSIAYILGSEQSFKPEIPLILTN